MTAKIVIYTTKTCPYCIRALALLNAKGVSYQQIDVGQHPELRVEMEKITGGWTVPQIIIDDTPIGGCDDMYALEDAGKLDTLLRI